MSRVHEEAGDGAGSGIDVLVRAPGCEVDVPGVEVERHVACGVGEVPSHGDTVGLCVGGDGGDVEVLARVEVDSWEKEECC